MRKFILTESEKNEIKSLYRKKGLVLLEQEGEYHPDAPNWDSAKEWVSKQPKAYIATVDPTEDFTYGKKIKASSYAEWQDGDFRYTIYNNGIALQYSVSNDEIFEGSWEWNGVEVIFSFPTKNNSDSSSDSSSSTTTDTSDCSSLYAEAEKQTTYNPANLKAGKVVIGKGNQGALVEAMQCYLNQKNEELSLGLTPLKTDGKFGDKTKEMTIKFQEQFPNELKADGIIGKNTYAKFGIPD